MLILRVAFAFLVVACLQEPATGYKYDKTWGKTIGRVWKHWRQSKAHVKRCRFSEKHGFCSRYQPTVCVMGHDRLQTKKMCDYCSESPWYAFKYGICPDDQLISKAKSLGYHYYRNHGSRKELRSQHRFLNKRRRKEESGSLKVELDEEGSGSGDTIEKGLNRVEFDFTSEESGSGDLSPVQLSIMTHSPETQIKANGENGGKSSKGEHYVDVEFLDKFADDVDFNSIKNNLVEKSSYGKLKAVLQQIQDILT